MTLLSRLAPLLLEERDPARVAQIVRRVSGAFGAATVAWSLVVALVFELDGPALIGAVSATGLLSIALAAGRWPYASAIGFVSWLWLMALAGQIRTGVLVTAGLFLTSIVAAGLLLGARAAILIAVATAIATGAVTWALESGALVAPGSAPAIVPEWTFAMAIIVGMPVLLLEALGRLRRALNDAQEAERRYALVANNTRDVIWLTEEGVLRYVSPSSVEVFGRTPDEMLASTSGPTFPNFTPDSAQIVRASLGRAMAEGASRVRYEGEYVRQGGGTVWCEVEVSLLRDATGRVTGLLGVTRDISARRRAEADRERAQTELAHAQRMEIVGRISAGVAHDLNNQLAVILGTVEALSDGSSEARADALKDVADAAQSAAALTRQLQVFSRRRAARRVPFDLNVLLRRLDRTLRRVLGPSIELSVEPCASPAVVLADDAQVEQLILNLVVNARDAMPNGGRLELEIAGGEAARAHLWLVRVQDTGTGIDEATRARLFEPFFTTKPEGRGTGLGLAMVRRIAEESGGGVSVESEVGRGTTFEVALPRYAGPLESEETADSDPDARPRQATILVVDDSVEVLRLFSAALSRYGYHVLEANSPGHALALASQPIDLVVTDIAMPGMRGPELVAALRRVRPLLPVLYVSGHAEEIELSGDPHAAILWKPFPMKELVKEVRQALNGFSKGPRASDAS